jgi:hypothetical protein
MKEIITIQCGSAANYVGAHFWNLLDAACVRLRFVRSYILPVSSRFALQLRTSRHNRRCWRDVQGLILWSVNGLASPRCRHRLQSRFWRHDVSRVCRL